MGNRRENLNMDYSQPKPGRPRKNPPAVPHTSVGLPPELAQKIKDIAAAEDRTKVGVVKRAIALYLAQSEHELADEDDLAQT
jgi:hypothetical protein